MAVHIETSNGQDAEKRACRIFSSKQDTCIAQSPPKVQGSSGKKGGRTVELWLQEFSGHSGKVEHINSQQTKQHVQDLWGLGTNKIQHEERGWAWSLAPS